MKYALLIIFFTFSFNSLYAKHIVGGEMIYEYLGPGSTSNTKKYRITLRLFRDEGCGTVCAPMPVSAGIGVFNNDDNKLFKSYYTVPLARSEQVATNPFPPCITNPPSLVYRVGYYTIDVIDLPNNSSGYTATYQTCCRVDGISNLGGATTVGATYITTIPGSNTLQNAQNDNSPQFAIGISVLCYNKPFVLDFSSTDSNGDSLVYSMCDAYNGGAARDAGFATPAPPPYAALGYGGGFSGSNPLGALASIDTKTGIISGIAPNAGEYVVSVCVQSFRNGKYISTHRKDFIVTIAPCDFASAELSPAYLSCDGFTFNFSNLNNSALNKTFYWDFGVGSVNNDTSTQQSPVFTYPDTGVYIVKLIVNKGTSCADSTTAIVKVYPGFFPGFTSNTPICKGRQVQFNDATNAAYGNINYWRWDFGDPSINNDTSTLQNPAYTYIQPGDYTVTLTVGSDKECIKTIQKTISILEKPFLVLTKDTLICSIDTLQLMASVAGPGTIIWSPNYSINNVNSLTPLISPDITTTYSAFFTDAKGCSATDSVKVSVVDFVTLRAGNDTTICKTDQITLSLISDGLNFSWTPSVSLDDSTLKQPVATPLTTTTYQVIGTIGKCKKQDNIKITVVPYPNAYAGRDTSICIGNNAFLKGSGGSIYSWSPIVFLNNPNIPDPVSVNPQYSIDYVLTVLDTIGCPKPVSDTVVVKVANIMADAGPRDTAIVFGQPLQLNATGSEAFYWTPEKWLSNSQISNPIAYPEDNIQYVVHVSDSIGCADTDTIDVKLFKVDPDIFVPTAFTPNGDGLNDIFKPIPIGIKSFNAFRIYNRWGQLLYSSTVKDEGWDGKFKGAAQPTGTFIWYAEGVDYQDKKINKKGYVVLIR